MKWGKFLTALENKVAVLTPTLTP